jgi:hypothetical protein
MSQLEEDLRRETWERALLRADICQRVKCPQDLGTKTGGMVCARCGGPAPDLAPYDGYPKSDHYIPMPATDDAQVFFKLFDWATKRWQVTIGPLDESYPTENYFCDMSWEGIESFPMALGPTQPLALAAAINKISDEELKRHG